MRKKWKAVLSAALTLTVCCSLFSACGKKQPDPSPTPGGSLQNSFVVKDLPEGMEINGSTRYLESVDLHDEDSAGSEYWKIRLCSEEERAKGNVFETDYFFFSEPCNHRGYYKLTIKENVTLPKNLYLGWLVVVGGNDEIWRCETGYYVPEGTFENRQEIETVSLPERYPYSTSNRMFANCLNLKTVYIRAWENWWKQYTLQEKQVEWATQIAQEMFLNCISLEKVVLSSVAAQNLGGTIVRERALLNCVSLKGIYPVGAEAYYRQQGWTIQEFVSTYCTDALKNCIAFGPVAEWQEMRRLDENQEQALLTLDETYRERDEIVRGAE